MADISALGGLNPVEPLDLENYADTKDFVALPKKGRYTVQAPGEFPQAAFGRSNAGALTAQVDPTIMGPSNEGYRIRFTKPSAKTYKRGGVTVSQVGDYLRAFGIRTKLNNEQEIADAVESTANRVYQVEVDWKAYRKRTDGSALSLEGMENFPSDGDDGYLPYVDDTQDYVLDEATGERVTDAEGNALHPRVRANLFVSRFVAQQ